MNCLDLTATLDAMNADFVCAGGIDWWPKLITGSVAVLVVLAVVGFVVWAALSAQSRKRQATGGVSGIHRD